MRTILLTGLALLIAGTGLVLLGSAYELELESAAFLGVGLGAVLALVSDRSAFARLVAFLAGFAASWAIYLTRAGVLPDTDAGRAVALASLIVLCVALAAVTANRLPLWAILLGAATLAGGYESAYTAAPSDVATTSVSAVTTVLLTVAIGFLAASLASPQPAPGAGMRRRRQPQPPADIHLDTMMENPR
jgi:hypothetical protein